MTRTPAAFRFGALIAVLALGLPPLLPPEHAHRANPAEGHGRVLHRHFANERSVHLAHESAGLQDTDHDDAELAFAAFCSTATPAGDRPFVARERFVLPLDTRALNWPAGYGPVPFYIPPLALLPSRAPPSV